MTSNPGVSNTADLAQTFKDTIKEEIMAELRAQGRYNFMSAEIYRREIDRLKNEVCDEINQSWHFNMPHYQDRLSPLYNQTDAVGNMILANQGYKQANDGTALGQLNYPFQDRERGIIYGVGMAALLGIFVPSFRRKVQSVATRTAREGVELIEKARFMLARAKEDIEDLVAEAGLRDFTE